MHDPIIALVQARCCSPIRIMPRRKWKGWSKHSFGNVNTCDDFRYLLSPHMILDIYYLLSQSCLLKMKQCKGGTWVRGRGTISFVDRSSIRYTRQQPTSDDSISSCLLSPDYPSLGAQWPRWLPQVDMIPAWSSSVRSNPPLYCQWPGSVERERERAHLRGAGPRPGHWFTVSRSLVGDQTTR